MTDLIDQVDELNRMDKQLLYLSLSTDDGAESTPSTEGLSMILYDLHLKIKTISKNIHEHLKTQQ